MKYLLIIFDGMADEPLAVLDGKTPMQVARTPFMDSLAEKALIGAARTTPIGMYPGSDTTNMGILGYDPTVYYRGRGAIEAASLQIPVSPTDAVFRANIVSTDGELMLDSSGGHISTEEAIPLIELVAEKLSTSKIKFYPGVSYRHIMVWRDGSANVKCAPPYKFHGERFDTHFPEGDGSERLVQLMYDSLELLDNHPINRKRRDEGHLPANMLWFWGESTQPEIPNFFRTFGKTGAAVAAVDLIKGLGRMVGLDVLDVPGATGYVDTDYLAKGRYAVEALKNHDFVWVHVEAADEAGHEKNLDLKIEAIQEMDQKVLGTILSGLKQQEQQARILLMPDHPTPIATGAHSPDPVPFLLFDSTKPQQNTLPYDERVLEDTKLRVEFAPDLIRMLFGE